jgi:hypothetical protein
MSLLIMYSKHMEIRTEITSLSVSSKFILKCLQTSNDILLNFCIVKLTRSVRMGSLHELQKPNTRGESSTCLFVSLFILKRS